MEHFLAAVLVAIDDQAIALLGDAFLAGDLNSAMRRLVSEGRDGVLRAARARAVDASGFVEQIDA